MTAFHSLATALVLSIAAFLPILVRADTLRLKSGETVAGTLQGFDGDKVVVALQLDSGNATVPYPLALIETATLDRTPAEAALLNGPPQIADRAAWQTFWNRRAPFLRLPGSDSGAIGLAWAQLLLESDPVQTGTVAAAVAAVPSGDWNGARREQARALGAAALLAQGKESDAATAAQALLANVTDPTARVDARFVLGQIAVAQWNAFAATHPQWQTLPAQAAAQNTVAERALDALASSPVFLPDDDARAGRGLLAAANAAAAMDRNREAAALLDDLLEAFPTAPQTTEAKALRQRLNATDAGLFTAATSS